MHALTQYIIDKLKKYEEARPGHQYVIEMPPKRLEATVEWTSAPPNTGSVSFFQLIAELHAAGYGDRIEYRSESAEGIVLTSLETGGATVKADTVAITWSKPSGIFKLF